MNLNDVLIGKASIPSRFWCWRHRPPQPELNKVLPMLIGFAAFGTTGATA
jgi:hypothetical protein